MRRLAPLLWYGLIFATSCTVVHRSALVHAVPAPSQAGFDAFWGAWWWLFVKGWHMTEFAVLFGLLRRAARDEGWALFLAALGAASDEFHQTFVPGRGGRVSDVLIDVVGALLAAILLRWRSAPRQRTTCPPSAI